MGARVYTEDEAADFFKAHIFMFVDCRHSFPSALKLASK
jgi:hypothetical protein